MLVKLGHNKGDKMVGLGRFPPKSLCNTPWHFKEEINEWRARNYALMMMDTFEIPVDR
jgi:hypothetical protein